MVDNKIIVYLVIKINPDFCLINNVFVSKVISTMVVNVYLAH